MAAALDLAKIKKVDFPADQFVGEETAKTQIVLHHTVSNANPLPVVDGWKTNKERVATAFVIGGDGTIVQAYSSKFWASHLGLKAPYSPKLEKSSIGIEICNWGWLNQIDGKFYNVYDANKKSPIAPELVITYPNGFRGQKFYYKYTPAQIEIVRQLLVFLCEKFNIPKTYNSDMWDYSENAMNGRAGIWAHVSYRKDKFDIHPQPEMIEMLKNL